MLRFSITWPSAELELSSKAASPRISTVSVTAPTSSLISIRADWSTCSTIPLRSAFLNPCASTVIE